MDCTGERVIEKEYQKTPQSYLIYLFHIATYKFAVPFVQGKFTLDFGCGTGYGSHFLSRHCTHIKGTDISDEAVNFGKQKYKSPNLELKKIHPIEQKQLPFDDNTFEAVVSFQVVEHVENANKYFGEIWRVLKNDGVLVLSTPDRSTRLFKGQKPWNMFHLHEYSTEELKTTMLTKFERIEIFGMSARDDLLAGELTRTARMRILSYPLTFPYIPEPARKAGLRLLKKIQALTPHVRKSDAQNFDFGVNDIYITPQAEPSLNIIAVGHKKLK